MPAVPAHPLVGSPPLPVPPGAFVAVTVLLAAAVATRVRAGEPRERWSGRPAAGRVRGAVLLLGLLGLLGLVAAARWGPPDEPDNLGVVAGVYLLWPVLLLAGVLLRTDAPAGWPAVVLAAGWGWFLATYTVRVDPRALATALSAYAVVTVAGCVAFGVDHWLRSSAVFGSAAALGALYGGVAFARIRLTGLWGDVALSRHAIGWTRFAVVLAVVAGAAVAIALDRWSVRRDAPGSVAVALAPVVASTAIAVLLRRSLVAAQLLPDLLGLADPRVVDVNPGGTGVQQLLAWGVVTAGCLAGAWALARRVGGIRRRDPAAVAVYLYGGIAALLVTVQ